MDGHDWRGKENDLSYLPPPAGAPEAGPSEPAPAAPPLKPYEVLNVLFNELLRGIVWRE